MKNNIGMRKYKGIIQGERHVKKEAGRKEEGRVKTKSEVEEGDEMMIMMMIVVFLN